jgi:Anti-sigma-K factor rskA
MSTNEFSDTNFDAELSLLLKHPAMYDSPSADLAAKVSQAVAKEVATVRTAGASQQIPVRRSSPMRWLSAVAAVVLVAVGGAALIRNSSPTERWTKVSLTATGLAPRAKGYARFASTRSGLKIELDATGLPRRDGVRFYQAWLKGPGGLVPVGTFHSGENVTLWAGVALEDFPTLTITQEEVGDQTSSGRKVMTGSATPR